MAPTKEESEKEAAALTNGEEQEKEVVKESGSQEKESADQEKEAADQEKSASSSVKETTGKEKGTVKGSPCQQKIGSIGEKDISSQENTKKVSTQGEEDMKESDNPPKEQMEMTRMSSEAQEAQDSTHMIEEASSVPPKTMPESSDNAWIVVGEKRRKNRSQSVSEDHLKRKSKPVRTEEPSRRQKLVPSKLTYKQVIQQSLPSKSPNPSSVEAPVVPTGVKEENSPQNVPSEPKTEPLSLNSYPLPEILPSSLPSTSFSMDYTHDPLGLNPSSAFRDSVDYGLGYGGYYSYEPIRNSLHDEWWPKTHYGQWREREMGLEREPWMDLTSFPEGDRMQYRSNNGYTTEELQVRMNRSV